PRVERAQLPLGFIVKRAEEVHLHYNAALPGLSDKVSQPAEIVRVPAREVELVAAVGVTRLTASSPGGKEAFRRGGGRVPGDLEGPLRLDIRSGKRAGQGEPVGPQSVEVLEIVEVLVQYRAVVLARGDQHGRLAAEQEVVRVVRVQRQRRRTA